MEAHMQDQKHKEEMFKTPLLGLFAIPERISDGNPFPNPGLESSSSIIGGHKDEDRTFTRRSKVVYDIIKRMHNPDYASLSANAIS